TRGPVARGRIGTSKPMPACSPGCAPNAPRALASPRSRNTAPSSNPSESSVRSAYGLPHSRPLNQRAMKRGRSSNPVASARLGLGAERRVGSDVEADVEIRIEAMRLCDLARDVVRVDATVGERLLAEELVGLEEVSYADALREVGERGIASVLPRANGDGEH